MQEAGQRSFTSCMCSSHTEVHQGHQHSSSLSSHHSLEAEDAQVAMLRLHLHWLRPVSPLQLQVEVIALVEVWEQVSRAGSPLLQHPQLKYHQNVLG